MKFANKIIIIIIIAVILFVGCDEANSETIITPVISQDIKNKDNNNNENTSKTQDNDVNYNDLTTINYEEEIILRIYEEIDEVFLTINYKENPLIESIEVNIDNNIYIEEDGLVKINKNNINILIDSFTLKLYYLDNTVKIKEYKNVFFYDAQGKQFVTSFDEIGSDVENLWMFNSRNIIGISSLSGLSNLKSIFFNSCILLEDASPIFNITSLEKLYFYNGIPKELNGLEKLVNLKCLMLMPKSGSKKEYINDIYSIQGLSKLEFLQIANYNSDLSILNNFPLLMELYINNCPEVDNDDLMLISEIKHLRKLEIINCNSISTIPIFTKLEHLKISRCDSLTNVSAIKNLTNLKTLILKKCDNISDLSQLNTLINLEVIELGYLDGIESIDFISYATLLKKLTLESLNNVFSVATFENNLIKECTLKENNFDISFIMNNSSLERVYLLGVVNIDSIKNATALKKLHLSAFYSLNFVDDLDISAIGELSNLEDLYLSGYKVKSFEPLRNNKKLKSLALIGKNQTIDAKYLANLSELEYLDIGNHDDNQFFISDISFLNNLNNLRSLNISLDTVDDYTPLTKLGNLETLRMTDVSHALPKGIKKLKKLIKLDLHNCIFNGESNQLNSIGELLNLKSLNLDECSNYDGNDYNKLDISFIENLVNLESLGLDCFSSSDTSTIPNLKDLKKLHELTVHYYEGIDSSGIWEAENLEKLYILDSSLESISQIKNLLKLKKLHLLSNQILDYSPILEVKSLENLIIYTFDDSQDLSFLYDMKDVMVVVD